MIGFTSVAYNASKSKMAAKMASVIVKNNKIAITSLLNHWETYFLGLGLGFGAQVI